MTPERGGKAPERAGETAKSGDAGTETGDKKDETEYGTRIKRTSITTITMK